MTMTLLYVIIGSMKEKKGWYNKMKKALVFALALCFSGCVTTQPPQQKTYLDHVFHGKLHIEIHNSQTHCMVRVWDLEKDKESPLASFRGIIGTESCKIYQMHNPDLQ